MMTFPSGIAQLLFESTRHRVKSLLLLKKLFLANIVIWVLFYGFMIFWMITSMMTVGNMDAIFHNKIMVALLILNALFASINIYTTWLNHKATFELLKQVVTRVFIGTGYLPGNKYPNHLAELKPREYVKYARMLAKNEIFWDTNGRVRPTEEEIHDHIDLIPTDQRTDEVRLNMDYLTAYEPVEFRPLLIDLIKAL